MINTNQCPLLWQQPRRKAFSRKRVSSSQKKAEDVRNDDDDGWIECGGRGEEQVAEVVLARAD